MLKLKEVFAIVFLMDSKSKIIWPAVLIAGAGILILFNILRDEAPDSITQETPALSETVGPLFSLSPSPRPTSLPKPIVATCQIGGKIVFLDKNLYENKDAKIIYQNVDDPIRQIFWKSNPDDGVLVIGPNLFEDLPLPDGERNVGVAINEETAVKNYTLPASITYGVRNTRGIIEERIADCSGGVSVQMP